MVYCKVYMRYRGTTRKQQKYAYNIMNTETTRQEAMLQAGYSETASQHPARVENSEGFKLAMAGIFGKAGNVAMTLLNELQVRDVTKETTRDLVNFFDVMTRAMERIAPKETKPTSEDMRNVFSSVIDVTPLQNKDETTETIDNITEVSDSSR